MEDIIEQSLKTIKGRFGGIELRDTDDYEYGWRVPNPPPPPENEIQRQYWERIYNRSHRPKDFDERWKTTQEKFEKIRVSESINLILSELKSLKFYLETKAGEPLTTSEFRRMPDGQMSLYEFTRDSRVDKFFEERVLTRIRKSITDLEELSKLTQNNAIDMSMSYVSLFDSEKDARRCLTFMNKVGLTNVDGTHKLGEREKVRLMALIEALQKRSLFSPSQLTADVTSIVAKQINLDYQRPRNEHNKKYDDMRGQYLSSLNAISTGKLTWSMLVDNG